MNAKPRKLSRKYLTRTNKSNIIDTIDELSSDARPHRSKKLIGVTDLYRIRVNAYRIIYQVREEKILILIVRIGHRKDIYEGL